MANMVFKRMGMRLIAVHNAQTPLATEWTSWVELVRQMDMEAEGNLAKIRNVVFTDGGGPNAAQRVELSKILAGRTVITSVITDSLLVRGIVSTLNLFNPGGLSAFAPKDWKKGLMHAGVAEAELYDVLRIALALGHDVGDPAIFRSLS
jgi:hypothetical protein